MRRRLVPILAALTALSGLVTLASSLSPGLAERVATLSHWLDAPVREGARLATAVSGLVLLLVARGLFRRKRTAWALAGIGLAGSVVGHLAKGLDGEEAGLALLALILLLLSRREFHARSDAPSMRQAGQLVVASFAFVLLYGTVGFGLLDHHYRPGEFSWQEALGHTLWSFVMEPPPAVTPFGQVFSRTIAGLGAITLCASVFLLLQPILYRGSASDQERERARAIVEAHGRSSLAFFSLLSDKAYFFTSGGSVVAYLVKGRVALALGDPIGPAQDLGRAIAEFSEFCKPRDWDPAFVQVLPEGLPEYEQAGFASLGLGDEAVVMLADFSLKGKKRQNLRTALNKLSKLGFRLELHEPPQSPDIISQLKFVSDTWLTSVNGQEKGFTLGWFAEDYVGNARIMACHDPDGRVVAFANLVPEYQRNELTIDLMRHLPEAPPGTMDAIFVELFERARQEGFDSFSLGLSPLAGVGSDPDDPLAEKALRYIYENINQFYNFQGLHRFKEKFDPVWSPRYLIYRKASLPAVATALVRASSGEGFLWEQSREVLRLTLGRRGQSG
ncbi:MAG: bifunctional lysylphosphatidylglycerol flippase/synthetase MprF [Candidatus Eremiobacteraeota bacterium]|nr:bifunctional lysylphosphatidylglycerol flippase/synthetase MprF [Candidatus Eremiobacteraeota bacterium]